MNKLLIDASETTPFVCLDMENGIMEVTGRSVPENAQKFYNSILTWIEEYSLEPFTVTELNFYLYYFNTSSSKIIFDVMKKIQKIHDEGKTTAQINWCYEDDDSDMLEAGEQLQLMLHIPFNLKIIKV